MTKLVSANNGKQLVALRYVTYLSSKTQRIKYSYAPTEHVSYRQYHHHMNRGKNRDIDWCDIYMSVFLNSNNSNKIMICLEKKTVEFSVIHETYYYFIHRVKLEYTFNF